MQQGGGRAERAADSNRRHVNSYDALHGVPLQAPLRKDSSYTFHQLKHLLKMAQPWSTAHAKATNCTLCQTRLCSG